MRDPPTSRRVVDRSRIQRFEVLEGFSAPAAEQGRPDNAVQPRVELACCANQNEPYLVPPNEQRDVSTHISPRNQCHSAWNGSVVTWGAVVAAWSGGSVPLGARLCPRCCVGHRGRRNSICLAVLVTVVRPDAEAGASPLAFASEEMQDGDVVVPPRQRQWTDPSAKNIAKGLWHWPFVFVFWFWRGGGSPLVFDVLSWFFAFFTS